MDAAKRKRLEAAGWKVGSTADFLELTQAESDLVEIKLNLAQAFKARRERAELTQTEAAKRLSSSQSRVAKIEAGDRSVSVDLLVRSNLSLGASPRDIARALTRSADAKKTKRTQSAPARKKAAARRATRRRSAQGS